MKSSTSEQIKNRTGNIIAGRNRCRRKKNNFAASQRDQFVSAAVKKGGAGTGSVDAGRKQRVLSHIPRVFLRVNIALTKIIGLLSLYRMVIGQTRPKVQRKTGSKNKLRLGHFHHHEREAAALMSRLRDMRLFTLTQSFSPLNVRSECALWP